MKINQIVDEDLTRRGFLQGAGVDEGFVDTVKDKYSQFKDYFDDSPEAVERKLARLRATNAEAQPGANTAAAVTAQSAEDPYMILGVQPGADSNAIKLAYRRLAKKHHPDAGGNAAEFQKIKDAFNQLLATGAVVREADMDRRGFLKGLGAAALAGAAGSAMAQPIPVTVDKVDVQAGTITVDGEDYRLIMLKPNDFRPRGGRWIAVPKAQLGQRGPGNFTATIIGDTVYVFPDAMDRVSEAGRRPVAPDPQNYDSDWDYYNDRDAEDPTEDDWYDDPEVDDDAWMGETRDKIGYMDVDAFDDAISRLKKLAGAGPLKTVYDPTKRVYKNVPTAVQPAQQPRKEKK